MTCIFMTFAQGQGQRVIPLAVQHTQRELTGPILTKNFKRCHSPPPPPPLPPLQRRTIYKARFESRRIHSQFEDSSSSFNLGPDTSRFVAFLTETAALRGVKCRLTCRITPTPTPRADLDTEKRRSSAGPVITKTSGAGKGNTAGEHRKTSKPMMERRRRARINVSLSQLRTFLIQEAWSKDAPRYSKLEKADVLELTVRHLRALQRSRAAALPIHDPSLASKYRAGFTQCVREVTQFLSTSDGICSDVRSQLLNHLAGCTPRVK
ncbi:transcription factor HES-4-like [Acipenser ruthenus]|uniref:transcription factor HES-4-like n=1 Tax=Acipenser ruthenus TaxID=7906 RepID=UPI00274166F8|nr:transcription factor HES-4-like [Acipenser ruthenus]